MAENFPLGLFLRKAVKCSNALSSIQLINPWSTLSKKFKTSGNRGSPQRCPTPQVHITIHGSNVLDDNSFTKFCRFFQPIQFLQELDAKLKVQMLAGLDVRHKYRIARSNILFCVIFRLKSLSRRRVSRKPRHATHQCCLL